MDKINFNKQKIFEIFLTALIGAMIAFLQSLLLPTQTVTGIPPSPILAGIIGGGIRFFRKV